MRLVDSRRLTGPNLLWDRAGAVIEVEVADAAGGVVAAWQREAMELLKAVGWSEESTAQRLYEGGASLAISAPADALYAACEVNEAAWERAVASVPGRAGSVGRLADGELERLLQLVADESNPSLLELRTAAERHGVAFLSDDDSASVGMGTGCLNWDVGALPHPGSVPWSTVHDVPLALITGTNGKTTTVRMLAGIAAQAGRTAGNTSTDGVQIAGEFVLRGDYTGPEGARMLLRNREVEVALLETARGGLLRRGLPVSRADVALVTNIGSDHLGEYGVEDLDDLARVKLLVSRAVADGGTLILNADDALLRRAAGELDLDAEWFGIDADDAGDAATRWVVRGDIIGQVTGPEFEPIVAVADVPACLAGAARHNVYNALAATAVARSLGLDASAVAAGLRTFRGDSQDNPGRGNLFDLGGARVYVDFAHNPDGLAVILDMAAAMPAKRRLLVLGQAGDRDDHSIDALAELAGRAEIDHVVLKEMSDHLRGRQPGEVVSRMQRVLRENGFDDSQVDTAPSEFEALASALRWAHPGDLLLVLLHAERGASLRLLEELARQNWTPGSPLPDDLKEEA